MPNHAFVSLEIRLLQPSVVSYKYGWVSVVSYDMESVIIFESLTAVIQIMFPCSSIMYDGGRNAIEHAANTASAKPPLYTVRSIPECSQAIFIGSSHYRMKTAGAGDAGERVSAAVIPFFIDE